MQQEYTSRHERMYQWRGNYANASKYRDTGDWDPVDDVTALHNKSHGWLMEYQLRCEA